MQELFSLQGCSVRVEIHEPANTTKPVPAIILLHGSGGNVDWWIDRIAPQVTEAGLALLAPHYLDSTGTSFADYATITDGVHFPQWLSAVNGVLQTAATRPSIDPERIALVGVSLGAFLALALAAQLSCSEDETERRRIRCLVDLSGGLAEPWRTAATAAFPPTLVVHGENDDVVSVADARSLLTRLDELKIPHEAMLLPGEGHWFSSAAQLPLLLRLSNFLSRYLQAATGSDTLP